MAVTKSPIEEQVERVAEDTQSIDSCSASTSELLRALLGARTTFPDASQNSLPTRPSRQRRTVASAAVKLTKGSADRIQTKLSISGGPEAAIRCLSRDKRPLLATTTFNKTLRNLGIALKEKQKQPCKKSGSVRSPLKETQSRIKDATKTTTKADLSTKHAQTNFSEHQVSREKSTSSSREHASLLATAECARTSLQCLRQLRTEDSAMEPQDTQLEQGALVLVSKLHGLNLVASAIEETLNLRGTLENVIQKQREGLNCDTKSCIRSSYGSLVECIEFGSYGENAKTFELVTAFQLQVLHLLGVDNRCSVDEDLARRLDPANPKSPCHILLCGARRGWLSPEKAAAQAYTHSQCVLSFWSTPSNNGSKLPLSKSSAEVQFQLNCLGLQMRCCSWGFVNQRRDYDEQIWSPFQRFVVSLCQRAGRTTKAHFFLVKGNVDRLLDALSKLEDTPTTNISTIQPSPVVLNALLNITDNVGSVEDSLELLHALKGVCTALPGPTAVMYHCKVATATLQDSSPSVEDFETMVERVIDILAKPLKGTTTELNDMISGVAKLRKSAARRLTVITETLRATGSHAGDKWLLSNLCTRILFGILGFVVRYTCFRSESKGDASSHPKYLLRSQHSLCVAQHALRSALAAVQSSIAHEYVSSELCLTALTDCLSVAEILDEDCNVSSKGGAIREESPTTFITISNMFWSWFLKQKDSGACRLQLAMLLRRSIEALEGRSLTEKRKGFLAIKCEKAALLYKELDQDQRAHQILTIAINTYIQADVLASATRRALTQSPQQIWGEVDSSEFSLGRVLFTYARLLLKSQLSSSCPPFFDKADLEPDERALLLERQFVAFREVPVPENFHGRLKELAETVLSLYKDSTHLLQRLRFFTDMLTFCSKSQLDPMRFFPEEASKSCMDETTNEGRISERYSCASARSLHSSVLLQWSFQTGTPSENLLQIFVSSHTVTAEMSDDWAFILPYINDPPFVIAQIQSVIDFADMRGLSHIKLGGLLLMQRLLEVQPDRDCSAIASCTTQAGLEYIRIGLTNKAGRSLAIAESFLTRGESKASIALHWHLAYAEYLTALSSYEQAAEHLVSAQRRYEASFMSREEQHATQASRLEQHKYLAQAAFIASNLAIENGDHDAAVLHAKKSVRISIRLWTLLEKLLRSKSSLSVREQSVSTADALAEDLSDMTVSKEDQAKKPSGRAAAFWSSVQLHFDGLLHLSRLSAHGGSFQDAVYYAEQAKKVGEATESSVLLLKASYLLAAHLGQAGRLDEGQLIVDRVSGSCENLNCYAGLLQAFLGRLGLHLTEGDYDRAAEGVKQAEAAISRTEAADHHSSPFNLHKKGPFKALPIKETPRSAGRATRKAGKRCFSQTNAVNRGVHAKVKNPIEDHQEAAAGVSTWVQRLHAEVLLLKSRLCIQRGSYQDAGQVLETVAPLARSSTSEVWYLVLQATVIMADALRLLRSDAVYSVLAETTIACPAQQRNSKDDPKLEEGALRHAPNPFYTLHEDVDRHSTKQRACDRDGLLEPRELVKKASGLLSSIPSSQFYGCSLAVVNELLSLFTQTQLLSSILLPARDPSPLRLICHLNAPKSLRWSREVASVGADVVLGNKSTTFEWPATCDLRDAASACSAFAHDYKALQQDLVEILPSSWNVITIAISNDKSEILISKIRSCQSPFLLRLPLQRTMSEDFDEGVFDFAAAKCELLDIIASANLTSHDAKGRSDKQGKKDWWAAREALDARLASLLNRIETLWLGGFRGMLSDRYYDEELLSRFSSSLSGVLHKQLPSRRKFGGKEEPIFQLHSYVLQLFVALGNPDEGDLDDSITDLLYFVIDVLQFQGERNAYDEIDFDAMVLEVTNALRSFHDGVRDGFSKRRGHTILVLDKAFHSFPWESLPCLEGQSVSRMPSLNSLQERLLLLKRNGTKTSGLCVDRRKGAYILNPSSDLTSTQETFSGSFETTLTSFTSIVNRTPSETEFETCLRDNDLCLYFGHGSGAQYIRGRTIKRLNQCAVTFLMGCSSGKMVECGHFEAYGVPYDYMHAGSAAVVGTLWDVTDKDIDRFAMETFVNWGLLGQDVIKTEANPRTQKVRGKRKRKKQHVDLQKEPAGETTQEAVGLDDAVAKAREACLLRYLNGAAPVIYGVPVYLD